MRKGPGGKESRQPEKAEKSKEMDSPLNFPEGTSPVDAWLNPGKIDFRLLMSRTVRIIHLCGCTSLNLWQVLQQIGNKYTI